MAHAAADRLSPGERRALASFLSGRLPAGQLHGELCRAREAAQSVRQPAPVAPAPAPALRAA